MRGRRRHAPNAQEYFRAHHTYVYGVHVSTIIAIYREHEKLLEMNPIKKST